MKCFTQFKKKFKIVSSSILVSGFDDEVRLKIPIDAL